MFFSNPWMLTTASLMASLSCPATIVRGKRERISIDLLLNLKQVKRQGVILLITLLLSGCSSLYVDGSIKLVKASEFEKPEIAQPVQVLFEFQTEGIPNGFVTNHLKQPLIDQIKSSGLFSNVADQPVPGGALLIITLNTVPITEFNIASGTHAFISGYTLGLIGQRVSSSYVCNARFFRDLSSEPIVKDASHIIHYIHGFAPVPKKAVRTRSGDEAMKLMTRQVVNNVLYKLSQDFTLQ